MYVQPLEGSLGANGLSSLAGNIEGEGSLAGGIPASIAGDNISRFAPPWPGDGAAAPGEAPYNNSPQGMFGPLMGMLSQLMQMLQSLMGYGGCTSPYSSNGNGSCRPYGGEQYFDNASGKSEGDPHLSFNGSKWTSMASQPDLLNSNSFAGGYQISTQTTPPNSRGISWNQSATIALDNGATTISLNNQGQPAITRDGQTLSIARGQTLGLGNGESVTCDQSGALCVTARNGQGGEITTTLTAKGTGVDVDVTAHDVDLGGALVNRSAPHQPQPWPWGFQNY
jgi:hypothetical protein